MRLGIVDNDGDERRMHDLPKPRVGGIAVFFGFAFALFAVLGVSLASPFALLPASRPVRRDSPARRAALREPA